MLDHIKFVNEILKELNSLVEANGLDKAVLIVKIAHMLTTLQEGLKTSDKQHKEAIESLEQQISDLVKQLNKDEPIEQINIDMTPEVRDQNATDGHS